VEVLLPGDRKRIVARGGRSVSSAPGKQRVGATEYNFQHDKAVNKHVSHISRLLHYVPGRLSSFSLRHVNATGQDRGVVGRRSPSFGIPTPSGGEPGRHPHENIPGSKISVDKVEERQLAGLQALLAMSVPVVTERPAVAASSSITMMRIRALTLLKDPSVRGAIFLMLSAAGTGALSFVFWGFTTHHQNAGSVGSISAEVSSITFLAGVGSLSLVSIFARFLPVSGRHARRFVILGYTCAGLAGLVAATIFLVTPLAKGLIIGGEAGSLTFVIFVVLNSIFNIQDGGLIGFGRFGWVPVENILVAMARLALLPVAAIFLSARTGVLWSWALPMIIAIVVVNIFVIGPLPGQKKMQPPKLPRFGKLSRLVAVGSASSAVAYAVNAFLPALVTHKLGSYQGGYFYVPWVITTMVLLLMSNITISMVREVVTNPNKAFLAVRRSVALATLLAILVMVVCLFLARFILAPLGSSYGVQGAPLLRWAGLAMPATAVIVLFSAICSIRQRLWPALLVNLITSTAIITGVMFLRPDSNIGRVGMVYCLVQWTAAAMVSLPTFIGLRAIAHGQGIRTNPPTQIPRHRRPSRPAGPRSSPA
jgi:hypothetical protein